MTEMQILDIIFTTKPCPDGINGIACPRCLAREIANAMTRTQK